MLFWAVLAEDLLPGTAAFSHGIIITSWMYEIWRVEAFTACTNTATYPRTLSNKHSRVRIINYSHTDFTNSEASIRADRQKYVQKLIETEFVWSVAELNSIPRVCGTGRVHGTFNDCWPVFTFKCLKPRNCYQSSIWSEATEKCRWHPG